jgi:hypothetical protein
MPFGLEAINFVNSLDYGNFCCNVLLNGSVFQTPQSYEREHEILDITGNQLRSARAFRDERLADVAVRSGVPITTVWRAECAGDDVPHALARTLSKLVGYYEKSGIRFINNDEAVGVLRISSAPAGH